MNGLLCDCRCDTNDEKGEVLYVQYLCEDCLLDDIGKLLQTLIVEPTVWWWWMIVMIMLPHHCHQQLSTSSSASSSLLSSCNIITVINIYHHHHHHYHHQYLSTASLSSSSSSCNIIYHHHHHYRHHVTSSIIICITSTVSLYHSSPLNSAYIIITHLPLLLSCHRHQVYNVYHRKKQYTTITVTITAQISYKLRQPFEFKIKQSLTIRFRYHSMKTLQKWYLYQNNSHIYSTVCEEMATIHTSR